MQKFLRNIGRSFYDFSFYKEVRHHWTGWGVAFTAGVFALLSVIIIIVSVIVIDSELVRERDGGRPSVLEEGLRQIAAQWPDSVVNDNTLTVNAPMPHIITLDVVAFDEPLKEDIITIDTTGQTTYANATTKIVVSATEVTATEDKGAVDEIKAYSLAELFKDVPQPQILNASVMNDYATAAVTGIQKHIWKFYGFMGAFAWLFLVPILVIVRLLLLIPLAVGGLLLAKIMGRNIDYDAAIRVIAVALIPLTLIEVAAVLVFGAGSGVSTLIKIVVSLGVLAALLNTEPKTTIKT